VSLPGGTSAYSLRGRRLGQRHDEHAALERRGDRARIHCHRQPDAAEERILPTVTLLHTTCHTTAMSIREVVNGMIGRWCAGAPRGGAALCLDSLGGEGRPGEARKSQEGHARRSSTVQSLGIARDHAWHFAGSLPTQMKGGMVHLRPDEARRDV
jgi:hypothetical protein